MAGIGFVLRELDRRDTMFGTAWSAGHGMIVAAGPWIFTVVSLALIHRGSSGLLSSATGYNFRSFIMYAFAISLLATAPAVNVSVRLASNDMYRNSFTKVRSRFLAALVAGSLISACTALALHTLLFKLSPYDLIIAVGSTAAVSLIWPTLAFCGAVRDYKGITAGFAVGLLVSVLGTIWVARQGMGTPAMIIMFLCGLSIVFFVLASRILLAFPDQMGSLGEQLLELGRGLRQHWMLAAGSFVSIAAVWSDKWIMWFGPDQVQLSNGLVSAPAYDSAMFLAYLIMIPALGLFVTAIETSFFENSRQLLDSIEEQAPLSRIERLAKKVETQTYGTVYRVLLTLGALCALAILLSPSSAPWLGLYYSQLGVYRLGILAAFFQFMFVACASIVLFLDRQAVFLGLQTLFLASQVLFSLGSIYLGQIYYGYGHLLACALSAVAAMLLMESTLRRIVYLTFASAHRVTNSRGAEVPAKAPRHFEDRYLQEDLAATSIMQPGPLLRP
jgi:polysaccharide biosynthesis protein PelG